MGEVTITDILAIIISSIALLITIINQIIIIKDRAPQLAFELKDYNGILYLLITNNGQAGAKNIRIKIEKIYNNGNIGTQEDAIFAIPFELACNEKVQGMIGLLGGNICNHVFPYIDISVSYEKPHFIRKVKYKRQVFYIPKTENKITVDMGLDLSRLEHSVENIHKSVLRLANYFDGCEIAPFDELNIVSENHFQRDLVNVMNNKESKVVDNDTAIKNRIMRK